MPKILLNRIGDDTLTKLEAAATRRHAEAHRLKPHEPLGALYLYGYTVEIPIKAAYYRLTNLPARLRQPPVIPDAPLIVVNRIPQTKSAHVLVVWDKWKDLTIPQRARAIADAYATAFPNDDTVVRLPLGLTPGEALSQGYLRYQIIPLVRPTDNVSAKQVKESMASAGGILMQVGNDQQLRFATRAPAEEAYRRLLEKINKPIWTLGEETSGSDGAERA